MPASDRAQSEQKTTVFLGFMRNSEDQDDADPYTTVPLSVNSDLNWRQEAEVDGRKTFVRNRRMEFKL